MTTPHIAPPTRTELLEALASMRQAIAARLAAMPPPPSSARFRVGVELEHARLRALEAIGK